VGYAHSTPLIHDIQGTGVPHIGIVTYDAELLWLSPTGIPLVGYSIRVPPLRVLKKWHDGLQDPPADSELYSTGTVSTPPIASDTDFGRPHEPSVEQPHARARRLMGVKPSHTGGAVSRRLLYSDSDAAAASDAAASDAAADSSAAAADAASSVAPSHESAPVESTTHEESPAAHEQPAASPSPSPDVLHVADDAAAAAPSDGDAAVGVNDDQAPDQPGDAQAYPAEGEEDSDLTVDDDNVFDLADDDRVFSKNGTDSIDDEAPPVVAAPDGVQADDLNDVELPPLPEEEPELIGTPKAPKIQLSHDAPLHANSQSLLKSLRGWLFGDDSDNDKANSDTVFASNTLRNRDAVLAHALRAEGWKNAKEHFTGAPYTGNLDHAEQADKYVLVDAHIISTPVIEDIDGDGSPEIIFAVSYFFDKDHYEDPEAMSNIAPDVQLHNYVACGLVVYNLRTRALLWDLHLDLTTDLTKFRAFMYSNPIVADLDGDGKLEILVGTSVGFIYVVNSDGRVRKGFPLQMGEIQAPITVHDLNGDGQLEIIAADSRHNIAAFRSNGDSFWHRHVSGFISSGITIGDVNGDGQVDVVAATNSGQVWVLNGATGDSISNFPLKAGGPIVASVTLAKLHDNGHPSLQLVFPCHDGNVYVVDGWNGCTAKYDIGEHSFSQVLIDDVDGNGKLDLVVTTMNGRIIVLGTDTVYHPMRSWTSEFQGRNGFAAREGAVGIFALDSTRKRGDIAGQTLPFQFTIEDNTRGRGDPRHSALKDGHPYKVKVMLGTSVVLHESTYDAPGTYLVEVPCPTQRQKSVITLQMTTRNGMLYEDSFVVSFHMHFFRTLKLVILAPFLLAASVLFLVRNIKDDLPM